MSDYDLDRIFAKAQKAPGGGCSSAGSPDEIRIDVEGNPICRKDYGNRKSNMGWEVDHIIPKSKGGSDDLVNLQPLQWRANARKQDYQTTKLG